MLKVKKPTKSFFFKANEEAYEMFQKSMDSYARFFCRVIGVDVLSESFHLNFATYFLFIDLMSFFIISFQNIYSFRNDFIRSTFCILTLGMGFQGAIKLYTFVFRRPDILQLYDLIIFFQKSVKSFKIKNALENSVLNSCIAALILIPMYIMSGILMFIYPIVYYMIYGEKILHFGFILPFIDVESHLGYALNFFYDALQIFFIINGTIASNMGFMMFITGAFGQYDALNVFLRKLDLLSKENVDGCNDQLIKQDIKEVASIHVELIK